MDHCFLPRQAAPKPARTNHSREFLVLRFCSPDPSGWRTKSNNTSNRNLVLKCKFKTPKSTNNMAAYNQSATFVLATKVAQKGKANLTRPDGYKVQR